MTEQEKKDAYNKKKRDKRKAMTIEDRQAERIAKHEYYLERKDAKRAYALVYYAEHKEARKSQMKEYANTWDSKAYRKENPDVYRRLNCQLKRRFSQGVHNAKRRQLTWDISFEDWKELIKNGLCHYCNKPLNPTGCGLDRKNNEPFYRLENVVSCCWRCNMTFMHNYNYQQKLILAKAIKECDTLTPSS